MFHQIYKNILLWWVLTLNLEDGLRETADVLAGDTGNGNTTILGSIDAVLLGELVHLLRGQAGVSKHANLAGDVAPVVLAAELLEVLLEESTHGDDAVSHLLDLTEPLLVESRAVEDLGGDAGTVNGRVGVQRSDDDLELRVDTLLLVGIGADEGEGTNTLTIETL